MNIITGGLPSNKGNNNKKIIKRKKHYHEIKDKARMLLRKAIESKGGIEELLWGMSLEQDLIKLEKVYNDRRTKREAMIKQQEDELSLYLDEEDVTLIWTELMISRVLKNTKFSIGNFARDNRDRIYTDSNQYIDENNPESNDNIQRSIGISITSPNTISSSPDFNNSINIKDFKKFMLDRDRKKRVSSIIRAVKKDEKRDGKTNDNENDYYGSKSSINESNNGNSNNNDENMTNIDDDKSDTDSLLSEISVKRNKAKVVVTKESSNRNLTGVDIVADLFSMSNELRLEREQISFHSTQDAAINRTTTLKYAAVLEEVVQTKEESERARRRAALLRMQKNAMKYNNSGKSDTSVFLAFWQNVQKIQNVSNAEKAISSTIQTSDGNQANANLAKSVLEAQIKTLFKAKLLLNEKNMSNGKNSLEKGVLNFDQTSYQKIYGSQEDSPTTVSNRAKRHGKANSFSVSITSKSDSKRIINESINYSDVKSRHLIVDEEENSTARKRRRELAKLIRLSAGSKREKKAVERLICQMPEELRAEFEARVEAKRYAMREAMKAAALSSKIESAYDDSDDENNKDTIRQGFFLTQKLMGIETDKDSDDDVEITFSPRINARYSLYGEGTLYNASLLPMSSPIPGLIGRWGYDMNIDEGPVEPLYISGGVNRDQPNYYPNFPRSLEVFPMQNRGLDVDEVSFDQDSFVVTMKMIREGFVLRDMSIHINDIFVTQSKFTDMVTLRTSNAYIGTVQHSAWSNVVTSIEKAIDTAITKNMAARSRYNVNESIGDSSILDNNVSANNPSPRPARLVLDDFFITSSEHPPHTIDNSDNANSSLPQNTFPFINNAGNVTIGDKSIVSLPNIYASVDFSSPKAIEKSVGIKANRIYNDNVKNDVYNNILSTSTLYTDDKNAKIINTPKRPESSNNINASGNYKFSKLRKVITKTTNDPANNSNDDNNNENNNNDNIGNAVDNNDHNIASGYVALGDSIEFMIGGNQPPIVTRVVTKDVRSPSRRSIHKRQCELIAEATIEANKGKLKNTNVIHKVYDMTKSKRGMDIESELAKKAKQREVVVEDNTTKVVLLVETERLLHLYFAKKFLQLDVMIDPVLTIYDALEAIKHNPKQYGLIFVSYSQLAASGDLRKSLMSILPLEVNESDFSIIIYGDVLYDDNTLSIFEQCGVTDILEEPYTADKIKNIFLAHQNKVGMKI